MGFYIIGGRWNEITHKIDEPLFKQLYLRMPTVIILVIFGLIDVKLL